MKSPILPPPESQITLEEWQHTPVHVQEWMGHLDKQIEALLEQVEKLQEAVRRNSQNSSQPPSQDQAEQKPRVEHLPSPRQRGGQRGHAGHPRELVDRVDAVVRHRPLVCERCGTLLLGEDARPYRFQVTELPVLQPRVVEHQVHALVCGCCGATTKGQLPDQVAASQFGPHVTSLVGLLLGRYRLSKRQVSQLLEDVFGLSMAPSSVVNQQRQVSAALAEPIEQLREYVKQQDACHVDETAWRQAEQARRSWLWTVVTRGVSIFHIAPSRASHIARELLGENYVGVACTDRYSAYTWLLVHQWCWSHLLRDGQKILERGGDSYPVGWNVKLQGEYLLMLWARVRDNTLAYPDFLAELPAIQQLVHDWLQQGTQATSARTVRTCRQLLAHEECLWRFATRPELDPTNNAAERALRHPVLWRRASHGTQSEHGRLFVERILSAVETCRQQKRPVSDFLTQAIFAYRAQHSPPSLLPLSPQH